MSEEFDWSESSLGDCVLCGDQGWCIDSKCSKCHNKAYYINTIAQLRKEKAEAKKQQQLCDAWIGVAVDRTATRCAAICDEYGHDPIAQCIINQIRKEFGLE